MHRDISVGDLVYLSCFSNGQRTKPSAAMKVTGIVEDTVAANCYEPAEAHVYFGSIEDFEWYPIRALSLVPDEER